MKRTLLPIVFVCLTAAPGHGFEKIKSYRPPALTDCGAGLTYALATEDSCIQISGDALAAVGMDSSYGPVYRVELSTRLAFILDDATGTAVVIGVTGSRSPDWNTGYADDLRIDEGFLNLGTTDVSARFGYLDPEFDSLDDTLPTDWILDLPPILIEGGLYLENNIPIGGWGSQIRYSSGKFSAGVSVENLEGRIGSAGGAFSGAGTAIATVSYDDGANSLSATALLGGVLDGKIDEWGLKGSAEITRGILRLQLAGAYQGNGNWVAGVLSRMQVGELYLGVGLDASEGEGSSIAGSVSLGDEDTGPSVGVAGRYTLDNAPWGMAQVEVRASTTLGEQLKLLLKAGVATEGTPFEYSISYVRASAEWHPVSGAIIGANAAATADGAFQAAFTVEHRLH